MHKTKNNKRIPTIPYRMRTDVFVAHYEGQLPCLQFALTMKNEYFRTSHMPRGGVQFHPMVRRLGWFMDQVNPMFERSPLCKPEHKTIIEPFISLSSLEELEYLTTDIAYEDGTWKEHLMCLPALECVEVTLRWHRDRDIARTCRSAEMSGDVTMGEFVSTVRAALEYAVQDVKRFGQWMEVAHCDICEDAVAPYDNKDSDCDEYGRSKYGDEDTEHSTDDDDEEDDNEDDEE